MPELLGCPERYDVRVHWRGGKSLYFAPVDTVSSLMWGRRLDEISEARTIITKTSPHTHPDDWYETEEGRAAVMGCCGPVAFLEPWTHELSVYRDTELVWQGPIRRVIERRTEWEIQAADVIAWFDKRVLHDDLLTDNHELTDIIHTAIIRAVGNDDEVILRYLRITPGTLVGDLDAKRGTKKYWEVIQQDLLPQGVDMTTVGRSILIHPEADAATPPQARLTDEHVGGDIEVEVNGVDAVTQQWVHGGPDRGDPNKPDVVVSVGGYTPTWDRLEDLVTNSAWNTKAQATAIATTLLRQLRPPLMVVRVADNARLSPLAPVSMRQLVAGERFDIVTAGMCRPVRQGMRLAQLQVDWSEQGAETVQVSFVPLRGQEISPTATSPGGDVLAVGTSASLDSTAAADQLRALRRAAAGRRPGNATATTEPAGSVQLPVGAGWVIRGEADGESSQLVAVHESGRRIALATIANDKNGEQ